LTSSLSPNFIKFELHKANEEEKSKCKHFNKHCYARRCHQCIESQHFLGSCNKQRRKETQNVTVPEKTKSGLSTEFHELPVIRNFPNKILSLTLTGLLNRCLQFSIYCIPKVEAEFEYSYKHGKGNTLSGGQRLKLKQNAAFSVLKLKQLTEYKN